VLVLGFTFKESCPDLRNTRVIDVVRELKEFGCSVDVSDPWVSSEETEREYGIALVKAAPKGDYDALILAVPRNTQAIAFSYARSVRGTVNSCLIGCAANLALQGGVKSADGKAVLALVLMWSFLLLDVLPGNSDRGTTATAGKVGRRP